METAHPVDTPPLALYDTVAVACAAGDDATLQNIADTVSLDAVESGLRWFIEWNDGELPIAPLTDFISAAIAAAPVVSADWLSSAVPSLLERMDGALDIAFIPVTDTVVRCAKLGGAVQWIRMLDTTHRNCAVHKRAAFSGWTLRPVPELALFRAIAGDPRVLETGLLETAMRAAVTVLTFPGPVCDGDRRRGTHDWTPASKFNLGTAMEILEFLLCHPGAASAFVDAVVRTDTPGGVVLSARRVFADRGLSMVPTAEAATALAALARGMGTSVGTVKAVMKDAPDEAWTFDVLRYIMTSPGSLEVGCRRGGFFVTTFPRGFPVGSGAVKCFAQVLLSLCADDESADDTTTCGFIKRGLDTGMFDQFLRPDTVETTEAVLWNYFHTELRHPAVAIAGVIAGAVRRVRRGARARNAPAVLSVMAAADKARVAQQAQPPAKRRHTDGVEDRAAALATVLTARRVCRHGADGRVVEPWGREVVGFYV